jgi:hypothetical protein
MRGMSSRCKIAAKAGRVQRPFLNLKSNGWQVDLALQWGALALLTSQWERRPRGQVAKTSRQFFVTRALITLLYIDLKR